MGPLVSRLPRTPFEPFVLDDGPPPLDPTPEGELGPPLGRMPVAGLSRRSLAGLMVALVLLWIVVVFAGAVADSATTSTRAEQVRAATAASAAKLEAERRELELVQTPAYIRLQARAYGYGGPGERVFFLQPGAPQPATLTPLGADPRRSTPRSPLDDWLALLFGP